MYKDKPPINELYHYGTPRHSGRYPWGSGDDPYQHSGDFLSRVDELKKQGFTNTEIAKQLGMNTTEFRARTSIANEQRRSELVNTARQLKAKGYSLADIAEKMG